jgi:hypothetical protein
MNTLLIPVFAVRFDQLALRSYCFIVFFRDCSDVVFCDAQQSAAWPVGSGGFTGDVG